MPATAGMLALPGKTLVMTANTDAAARQRLQQAGAEVVTVANEVLLECGARLAGAFVADGLVDELLLYLAPHLMGAAARGLFELPDLQAMAQRIQLEWQDVRRVGDDLRLTLVPALRG